METRTWIQADYSDFEKGILRKLSLRSDGRITLAPRFQELFDTLRYLWALAQDSKGNLYAGGGPGAKLYRIAPNGEKKMLAELEGLEIHAIAVDKNDRVYAATSPDGKVYRIAAAGKPEVFYDPKAKYIWAHGLRQQGQPVRRHRRPRRDPPRAPDGKGSVFFRTDETHARRWPSTARTT